MRNVSSPYPTLSELAPPPSCWDRGGGGGIDEQKRERNENKLKIDESRPTTTVYRGIERASNPPSRLAGIHNVSLLNLQCNALAMVYRCINPTCSLATPNGAPFVPLVHVCVCAPWKISFCALFTVCASKCFSQIFPITLSLYGRFFFFVGNCKIH